jgi:hypothetical protein
MRNPAQTAPAGAASRNSASHMDCYERQTELFLTNLERYLAGRPLLNDVTDAVLQGH